MNIIKQVFVGCALAAAAALPGMTMALAADQHNDHHPAGNSPPAATAQKSAPADPMVAGQMAGMARMDEHMKAMQLMHEKMAAAKTPEERQALMAEHRKLMEEGMEMMRHMGGGMHGGMTGSMADRQQMMEKRMDMMGSMMQMMMDCMHPQ